MARYHALYVLMIVALTGDFCGAGAAPPPPKDSDADQRLLQRRVTMHVRGVPLEEVLQQLARDTSVRLYAAPHLRERRMSLYAEGKTLVDVMQGIARLWSLPRYPAKWNRRKDTQIYELWQDADVLGEGERRETADRQAMGKLLDGLQKLPANDPDARNKTLEIVPGAGHWNLGWSIAAGALLRDLPPATRAAAMRGDRVWIPSTALSPVAQEVVFAFVASKSRKGRLRPGADAKAAGPGDLIPETEDERRQRFRGESVAISLEYDGVSGRWTPIISVRNAQDPGDESDRGVVGPPIGFTGQEAPDTGLGIEGAGAPAVGTAEGETRPKPGEMTPLTAAQQAQLREAAKTGVATMADFFRLLHEVTGFAVAADHYVRGNEGGRHGKYIVPESVRAAATLEGLLDAYVQPLNYRWTRRGQMLVFRSRMWWLDDAREVPLHLARRLTKALKQQGYLNLDDLAEAAQLSLPQLHTLQEDYVLEETADGIRSMRSLLRMYGVLSPNQQGQMRSAAGLLIGDTPAKAQAVLFPADGETQSIVRRVSPPDRMRVRVHLSQARTISRKDGSPLLQTRCWVQVADGPGKTVVEFEQPLAAPQDGRGAPP